jgi:hypothetical protein
MKRRCFRACGVRVKRPTGFVEAHTLEALITMHNYKSHSGIGFLEV